MLVRNNLDPKIFKKQANKTKPGNQDVPGSWNRKTLSIIKASLTTFLFYLFFIIFTGIIQPMF